ncbi:sushi domain protein [Necator americanus]|uniref:Sushi domain protein n=1 Tax=Necator americanus TaxID=51031 RepID=W2T2A5_NECAM|nr:sushi domain protein [Necator americanus]ETN75112.1 sushi domain protein [Necator americanus]
MDVLGVFEGLCYSASREERSDWLGAQRKCLDRGATLPMRMSENSQRGVRAALAASPFQKEFYWIGVSSSLSDWRWADGTTVADEDADWSNSKILPSNHPEAVVIARLAEWRWIPSAQNVWNSFLCQSKPKSCTFPGVGEAGRVSFSSQSFTIGSFSVYTCEEGYDLEGEAERSCEEDARWSGTIPRCRMVDCDRPPSIPKGSISVSTTTFGSSANYSCQDGYRLIGHAIVTCGSTGVWEPAVPACYDIATLRELKSESAENHAGLAALLVVLGLLLVFAVLRFSRTSKTVPISEKSAPPYGTPNVIYAIPSVIGNHPDSVVYYASSAPLTKMELPPHLVSLKPLPSGHFQATVPIGRAMIRPQLPIFAPSPTPSQLLYSFDYEPIYDVPPDVDKQENPQEENIYEKLPDVRPHP